MRVPSTYLKVELLRRGITQVEIADEAKVERSLVSHVIAGRRGHEGVQRVIADRLGVPVDTLFPPSKRRAPQAA